MKFKSTLLALPFLLLAACTEPEQPAPQAQAPETPAPTYDVLVQDGLVYDGSGDDPISADVAINDDRIVAIGEIEGTADHTIDATGMAVAPGFINMLSWATESLIEDGRSQGDIRQGVTLEVMGEGWSMGPANDAMKAEAVDLQWDIKYDIEWTTLGEYLQHLEDRGISTNVASFVGATTVRIHVPGLRSPARGCAPL